ncbi:hypothetical protein D3C71_2197930 [compost metagenome]
MARRDLEASSSDSARVQEKFARQEELERQLDEAMTRWAELSELIEAIEQAKR